MSRYPTCDHCQREGVYVLDTGRYTLYRCTFHHNELIEED